MPQYTTGEIAKLCNVSVRTVQYYDTRELLIPSGFSEGGRRLYSEQDLSKLKIICFLRDLDLPIDSIKKLLKEDNAEQVLSLLLEEQQKALWEEIALKQNRAVKIAEAQKALRHMSQVTVDSIGDIAHIVENRKRFRTLRMWLLIIGFLMDAIEVSTLMLWIFKGIWWPFALGMGVAIAMGVYISVIYFRNTAYICPQCHSVFKPHLRETLFARHTPNTRKLTCIHCGYHGFCVETYGKEEKAC